MSELLEEWRDIPGYENRYQVSNYGRIKSLGWYVNCRWGATGKRFVNGRLMKLKNDKYGYLKVGLYDDNGIYKHFTVHRLVAITFLDNPNNYPQINHKHGNKEDNRVSMLEWVSQSQNALHSYRVLGQKPNKTGLGKLGKYHVASKPILQIDPKTNEVINRFEGGRDAMRKTGISYANISAAKMHNGLAGGYKWADAN